ncbi:MAG: MBL fold metallo-hydrolase [Paracoccaceae bacterium]
MTMPALTRRSALFAAAALPFAPALMPRAAHAAAEMLGAGMSPFNRFKLGGFEVTTLLGGSRPLENPQGTFGTNASPEDFAALSEANFIPTDMSQNFFTPTVVNTGTELVLFDTGLAADAITAALGAAGYTSDQIDVVVLTHMHGDHIGGLSGDAGVTFPNARYIAGSVEHNHWSQAGSEGFDAKVRPLEDKMTFIEGGATVASGITAMNAFGHTPGHMAFMLESDGNSLLLAVDSANHYVWSLQKPDWEVRFDMDKATAAATRKQVFGMLAADRMPFIGYHMPFPGIGYVEPLDGGFRYVPATYQMMLNG